MSAVILGPSASGKTGLCKYLAKKYRGVVISLDGHTGLGRSEVSVSIVQNKFTNVPNGVAFRNKMVLEIRACIKQKKKWFADDNNVEILQTIRNAGIKNYTVISIFPKISLLSQNILNRNENAKNTCEEGSFLNSLSNLLTMLKMQHVAGPFKHTSKIMQFESSTRKGKPIKKKAPNMYKINSLELYRAYEIDKHLYSVSDSYLWYGLVIQVLLLLNIKVDLQKKIPNQDVYIPISENVGIPIMIENYKTLYKTVDTILNNKSK
jgi:hypothetical protein